MEEIVTRTMFCQDCHAHDRPRKDNLFVVWGHDRQKLFIRKAHQDGISGYTPHIIIYVNPLIITDGFIEVDYACCMHACGVTVGNKREDGHFDISFDRVKRLKLLVPDFNALVFEWKRTGYELL